MKTNLLTTGLGIKNYANRGLFSRTENVILALQTMCGTDQTV